MKKIIAFAGRKRSGKGILSNVVKENCKSSVIVTIANYLKLLCCDLLEIDFNTLNERKDNGSTFNIMPSERWFNIINKKTSISIEDIKKEIEGVTFTTIRQILQVIGTDLIRKYNPQWHVNCMINDIESYDENTTVIIDDVRFPNEREAIEELGGRVFFIIRANYFDISNHISERSLIWQQFKDDNVIINDIPKEYLLEYFRIAFELDFQNNKNNPIFLSCNQHFKTNCDYSFPVTNSFLVKEIIEQNKNNMRFLKNGIIQYDATSRAAADNFCRLLLNNSCHSWQRHFTVYNPLINENLKRFLT